MLWLQCGQQFSFPVCFMLSMLVVCVSLAPPVGMKTVLWLERGLPRPIIVIVIGIIVIGKHKDLQGGGWV